MDRYKLEYEMKSRGVTVDVLCKAVNISKSAFYRKCNPNETPEFTLSEIQRIVNFLQLESPMGIFFAKEVS